MCMHVTVVTVRYYYVFTESVIPFNTVVVNKYISVMNYRSLSLLPFARFTQTFNCRIYNEVNKYARRKVK